MLASAEVPAPFRFWIELVCKWVMKRTTRDCGVWFWNLLERDNRVPTYCRSEETSRVDRLCFVALLAPWSRLATFRTLLI